MRLNRKKVLSSYSLPEKEAISLVTFDPDVVPVGSFSYAAQKYPGDIDIMEIIKVSDNLMGNKQLPGNIQEARSVEHASKKIAKDIQKIVLKIEKRGYYFADFKAGLDDEENGLHWTKQEVLEGKKLVNAGQKLKLSDAIMSGVVKLDVWAPINDRYVEVTNFIVPVLERNNMEYNLNGELPDYITSIAKDVIDYYDAGNLFKSDKRLWLLASLFDDEDMLQKITPILNSSAGIMYQIVGDIGTLVLMINKLDSLPKETMLKEIDGFKSRLSSVDIDDLDEINQAIDLIWDDLSNDKRQEASDLLAIVGVLLSDKLNWITADLNEKNRVDVIGYIESL
jgi:hypothetical protein